jgi:hypothetical protein
MSDSLLAQESIRMTDDLVRVDALLAKMKEALPLHATPLPDLAAVMRRQRPEANLPRQWRITEVTYAGDPGGIMCHLDAGQDSGAGRFVVSITQVTFDRRVPMAREIAAYQKRRVKWLRKLGIGKLPLEEDMGP